MDWGRPEGKAVSLETAPVSSNVLVIAGTPDWAAARCCVRLRALPGLLPGAITHDRQGIAHL